jgi:hypothetical protein
MTGVIGSVTFVLLDYFRLDGLRVSKQLLTNTQEVVYVELS